MDSVIMSCAYVCGQSAKPEHFHDCHQLLFVTRGSARIRVDDREYQAQAGDLVVFSRFEQHSVMAETGDYSRFLLQLSPELRELGDSGEMLCSVLVNRPEGFCHVLNTGHMAPVLLGIFQQIRQELDRELPMRGQLLSLLLQQILVLTFRCAPEAFSDVGEERNRIVRSIQSRFERDYGEQFTLEELASEYGLSVSYLSHLFRRITGESVMGYLLSCRMAAAKRLLAQTELPVIQIVDRCGFSDSSNFSRTFRQRFGCTPTQFRETARRWLRQ